MKDRIGMVLRRLFGLGGRNNRAVTDSLYSAIVAAARQPVLYEAMKIPDTPLGRFESVSLHMFLFLHRVGTESRGDEAVRGVAQDVTDTFFLDLDHSLRELGIGDLGVPKRMKKLARMFYGRTAAYADALSRQDEAAMAEALRRNMRPESETWPEAAALAAYAFEAHRNLAGQDVARLKQGDLHFPDAAAERVAA